MKNTTHRVVILKNINSEIISQAILILKNSEGFSESTVLAEAERVVEKYMNSAPIVQEKKGGHFAAALISTTVILFTGLWIFAIVKMLK